MASFSVLYRRFKKLVFFLIIFYLVRSYYLRKKGGDSGDKRIGGIPERKRITDGSEKKSENNSKISEDESDDESEDEEENIKENNEKAAVTLEITETAVEEESKKEENIENDISLSETENIKGLKDNNSIDIEKTEIVNEIIRENEIEAKTREVPIINNIEIVPTIADEFKFQISEQTIKDKEEVKEVPEGILIEPLIDAIDEEKPEIETQNQSVIENVKETEIETKQEDLISIVEEAIEEPEKLAAIVEDIIIPKEESSEIIENPDKVDVTIDDPTETIEEVSMEVDEISEEVIEPPVEEVLEEVVGNESAVAEELIETIEEQKMAENNPTSPEIKEIVEPIVEQLVEAALETVTKQNVSDAETTLEPEVAKDLPETIVEPEVVKSDDVIETIPETIVEPEVVKLDDVVETIPEATIEPEIKQEVVEATPEIEVVEEVIELPPQTSENITEPQVIEQVTEEIIEVPADKEIEHLSTEIITETPVSIEEKSSADQQPENIESLISEIEKVVNDTDSDGSFIQDKEKEEEVVKSKPVNAADVIGHEEIIYEGDVDGDDDGEWIDEDDDGEWIDEDEEEVEEENENEKEKEQIEEIKPEINKRQSLLLNTQLDLKRQSLLLNNNTPIDILNSLKTPLSTTTSTFKLPTPAATPVPSEEKSQVLPDAILDRIFREVDPQTMWVLRNTSIKTRNIVDNILKETFEQFDLSMDPLYFDVTSKDNLGLVLNSLDLSPFALAMLLHEILKLDSQHIGYAFGQMFRVPSKIDVEYLTELIVDTLNILKTKKGVDIAAVMHGLQHYYCFNHSELEFYQLFDLIEMTPEEVARFIQNHYHFILSKSLPPLLQALDVDEVFVAEMCKAYANDDMDAFARIISKVPVRYVRTSIHPGDVKGDRVVVVNENGEDVIVVLNDDEHRGHGKGAADDNEEDWVEDDEADDDEEDENEGNGDNMIIVENNESFSLFVGRVLRFLNMTTKDVASFLKYLPEYCSYDEDEILEGLNWNEDQINEMRQIMKEEQDKIAKKMRELSKLIIQRRMSISNGLGSPSLSSPSRQFY